MKLPQFSLGTLLFVVALAALVLGIGVARVHQLRDDARRSEIEFLEWAVTTHGEWRGVGPYSQQELADLKERLNQLRRTHYPASSRLRGKNARWPKMYYTHVHYLLQCTTRSMSLLSVVVTCTASGGSFATVQRLLPAASSEPTCTRLQTISGHCRSLAT